MSFRNLLKLTAQIWIPRDVTVASKMDAYGSFNESSEDFELLDDSVKCDIQNFEMSSGNFYINESGQLPKNVYLGFFKPTQQLALGYKVICNSFNPSVLYIRSINPIYNKRTGNLHHYECLLEVERQ